MPKKLKTLLSIAGSDPIGGAGIQADIRAGESMGFHVMTALTAITAQNSKGIYDIVTLDPLALKSQLERIIEDCKPDAIKIGMIGSSNNFKIVGNFLHNLPLGIPVVVDPVLTASSNGGYLFNDNSPEEISRMYINNIFPFTSVATPNISELKILLNRKRININGYKNILSKLMVKNLIIKGGDKKGKSITDRMIDHNGIESYSHLKIKCKNLHGTGCTYSSLLACYMGLEYPLKESFMMTNKKMEDIINSSCDYFLGDSSYGPLNVNNYML